METLLLILVVAAITFFVSYVLFFSPKAQIKVLWKEIDRLQLLLNSIDKVEDNMILSKGAESIKESIEIRKNLIKALLERYFDAEEDRDSEYINNKMP